MFTERFFEGVIYVEKIRAKIILISNEDWKLSFRTTFITACYFENKTSNQAAILGIFNQLFMMEFMNSLRKNEII